MTEEKSPSWSIVKKSGGVFIKEHNSRNLAIMSTSIEELVSFELENVRQFGIEVRVDELIKKNEDTVKTLTNQGDIDASNAMRNTLNYILYGLVDSTKSFVS